MTQKLACALVLVTAVAFLPAPAVAGQPAHLARATAPPRAGAWTLVPSGAEAGLISGTFTVTTSRTVTDIRGKVAPRSGCAGGAVNVKGKFKISEANFGQGAQWEVGSGRNASGGAAATPIDLTVGGKRQVNATLTLAFPSATGVGSSGEINWGRVPACSRAASPTPSSPANRTRRASDGRRRSVRERPGRLASPPTPIRSDRPSSVVTVSRRWLDPCGRSGATHGG